MYQWLPCANQNTQGHQQQGENGPCASIEMLPLLPWQSEVLQQRNNSSQARLWEAMEDAALEHVCQLRMVVQRHAANKSAAAVQVQGLHALEGKAAVQRVLDSPPPDAVWVRTETFPPRVFSLILEMLKTPECKAVAGSAVFIHTDEEDCSLTVVAAPVNAEAARNMFRTIGFWQKIEEPRYGELHR